MRPSTMLIKQAMQNRGAADRPLMRTIPPELVEHAVLLADEADRMLRTRISEAASARFKPDRSFVTDLDLSIERRLRSMIAEACPDHGVIGEEQAATRADAEWTWVLDPIDGTAAFVAGMPVYGTLIALCHEGVPVIGVMSFPATGDRWLGVKGRPTRHNGEPCATRRGDDLANAIQAVMSPDFFDPRETQALDAVTAATAWRIYGGSAFSYGRLASGGIDITVDTRLQIHDYLPFVPVIEGAGGIITDWQGAPLTIRSGPRVVAAGDERRHAATLALIRDSGFDQGVA